MPDSKYYDALYKEAKKEAEVYKKNKESLEKIEKTLISDGTWSLEDKTTAINKEIRQFEEDIKKAVRHSKSFTERADDVCALEEKTPIEDDKLWRARCEINDEIKSLEKKKAKAEANREIYKDKRNEKRKEEGNIFGWL